MVCFCGTCIAVVLDSALLEVQVCCVFIAINGGWVIGFLALFLTVTASSAALEVLVLCGEIPR